jgi:hypothetical protein
LRQLKAHLSSALIILWDGSRVHDRSALVRAFLAEHPGIVTEPLPAYAPELNPDELVWAWTKYGRLGNLAAQHTDWLRDYITNELTYVREQQHDWASGRIVAGCAERLYDHRDLAGRRQAHPIKPSVPMASSR